MNIAMISTYDVVGGAARATYRLLQGLGVVGESSRLVVRRKFSDDPRVVQVGLNSPEYGWEHRLFAHLQEHRINRRRTALSNTAFSLPYPGFDLTDTSVVRRADVINLHWVSRIASVESVEALLALGKPVVWTLHDQWPFTGGCHYSAGCEGYRGDCTGCLQLDDERWGIPAKVLENKLERWGHRLAVVAPSRWLADAARASRVLGGTRVEVIPNSLDCDVFRPLSDDESRASLGIGPRQRVILFGAVAHGEHRKGFDLLLEAMRHCAAEPGVKRLIEAEELVVLTFGQPLPEIEALGVPVVRAGYVDSDEELAKIYSAADLFVLPSREDNLPNTMMESMACGTPVVAFDVGGMSDMVVPGRTGALVPPFDVVALGRAIGEFVVDRDMGGTLGAECRRLVENEFSLVVQAERYRALFEELLGDSERVEGGFPEEVTACVEEWRSPLDGRFNDLYRYAALELIAELEGRRD